MNNKEYLFSVLEKNDFSKFINENIIDINNFTIDKLNKIPKDLLTFFLSYFEYNSSENRYRYYMNMLYKLIEDKNQFLRSFIVIFNELELDELLFVDYLRNKEINVIDTMDLDKQNNRFTNLQIIESEINHVDLTNRTYEKLYIDHLTSRNIIEWPVYRQDPIITNNSQTGIKRYSKILLTSFGKSFSNYVFG